jgi:putative intracellular protease/amidase
MGPTARRGQGGSGVVLRVSCFGCRVLADEIPGSDGTWQTKHLADEVPGRRSTEQTKNLADDVSGSRCNEQTMHRENEAPGNRRTEPTMSRPRSDPALFGVLIYPGVEPIDIGGTVGVISMACRVLPAVRAVTIASAAGPVALAGGLTVLAEHGIADAPACDVVIVCGGPGWPDVAADAAVGAWLRGLPPRGVASVCTGALILGAAGVLNGRLATTRRQALGIETQAPLALLAADGTVTTRVAQVVDDGVVTGGGVALAIDATLYLLGRFYGADAAQEVARVIEYDRAYAANLAALGVVIRT